MPERIPELSDRLDDVEGGLRDVALRLATLTGALRAAVVLLAGNGALNLADLLR